MLSNATAKQFRFYRLIVPVLLLYEPKIGTRVKFSKIWIGINKVFHKGFFHYYHWGKISGE